MDLSKYEINNGLIVEYGSGYIDPSDSRNHKFVNEVNKIGKNDSVAIVEPLVLFTVLQKYGVENKNGRIYPENIMRREVEKYKRLISNRQSLGESDHPDGSIINTSRVAIEVRDIWFEGNMVVGNVEIIMSLGFVNQGIISCEGDHLANLIRRGNRVGVSSRGVGSVKQQNGSLVVQDDFEIICWDAVINPSTHGAYFFPNKDEAKTFKESTQKSNTNLILEDDSSEIQEKIKNFLLF